MKKGINKLLKPCYKYLVIVFAGIFFITNAKAQTINEGFEEPVWLTINGTSGQVVITNTSARSTMSYAPTPAASTAINTSPNSGTWWYSKAGSNTVASTYTKSDKVHSVTTSVKLSSSGYIITPVTSSAVVSVTFWAALASPLLVGLATDPNVIQPSYSSANPIPGNFSNFSTSFPAAGNTSSMTSYSIAFTNVTGPVRIGFFLQGGSSSYIDDINVFQPTGTPPSVVTGNVVPGITNAKVTGTVTPGTLPLLASGIIWSTSPLTGSASDTSLLSKTWDHPSSTSVFTDTANHLSPSTTYYTEAYVIGLDNSVYFGGIKNFTTNALSTPTVGVSLGNKYSNKAAVTGTIIDSGGLIISEKGFIWNTNGNAPTLTNNVGKQYEGSGTQPFSDFIKGLAPNTTYCVSAYAVNSKGSSVSPDTCFTTGPPAPTLTAIPGNIDFGQNFFGGSPLILSYTLTGSDLSGAPITITAPTGFIIATTPGGLGNVTGNTITLTTANTSTYAGGILSPTPIYVEMPTTSYGIFAGNIIHSGGGVAAGNADIVALTGSVVQSPIDVSNDGTDFWLGYGFEQKMQSNPSSTDSVDLEVYVSGIPGTLVTCETPLLSQPYSQTLPIPASGVLIFKAFPRGDNKDPQNAAGLPDVRLYYTGVTNRGIHVYSHGGPISTWLYDYATNNSAGGSLIFPTNTWNSSYIVQAYGNTANIKGGKNQSGPPNSFFFVIADEDNTPVYITPSVDIIDSTTSSQMVDAPNDIPTNVIYKAGTTYTITLNKGQVFSAIGALAVYSGTDGGLGLDLSGTIVRTDCDKKIAVFGGNGRCLVKTLFTCDPTGTTRQGSDNMIQQMIPSVAWDTKYYTVPTKSLEHNLYRIYVHDISTNVWINDSTHSQPGALLNSSGGLISGTTFNGFYQYTSFGAGLGGYYALETSYPMDVESDNPISITEFMISNDCTAAVNITGNNGSGDPEMIILTGANQAINKATVYSPTIKDGATGGQYINVIIPSAGVSTFTLYNSAGTIMNSVDTGSSSFTGAAYGSSAPVTPIQKAFAKFASNPNYSYARFRVGNGTIGIINSMSASVPFNSIAYGCASGESYGFNAGTAVKNLSSIQFTENPYGIDSSATAVRTCVNNPVKLRIALPYIPSLVSKITWNPQQDPRITPNDSLPGAMNGANPKYDTTITVNGRTFYVYTSPVAYTFLQNGTYRFPVQVYGTFASDCPGEDIENMLIVVGHDQANLTYTASCGNPVVSFTSDTIAMAGTYITKTVFSYGDGSSLTNGNLDSSHTYPPNHTYTASLTTYNSVGCISEDSVLVDFSGGLKAKFTVSSHAVCAGGSITFTDNSTSTGVSGTPNKWIWAFGDGSKEDSTSVTTASGNVSHQYSSAGKYYDTLTVRTTSGCIDLFIDSVTIEATPVAAFTTAEGCFGNATTFTDKSFVPNNLGTVDSSFWSFGDGTKLDSLTGATISHTYANPGIYIATLYVKSDGGCISPVVSNNVTVDTLPVPGFKLNVDCAKQLVTFTDTSNGHGGTITEWDWSLGDGTDTTTYTAGISFQHPYPNGNGKSFTVSLTVKTKTGCINTTTPPAFGIGAAPIAQFSVQAGAICAPDAGVTFNNTSVPNDGSNPANPLSYVWHFGDVTPDSTVAIGQPVSTEHIYAGSGTYNVTLTAISSLGCTNTSAIVPVVVNPQPVAAITTLGIDCLNDSLALSGNAASQWNWDFGDHKGTSGLQAPNYEWNTPGKYGVSLTITSAAGCQSTPSIDSINVDALPVAGFKIDVNCVTDIITITDTSNANGGTLTEWDWNFGDGKTLKTTKDSVINHFYANGNGHSFTVTLSVKTKDGCSNIVPATQTFAIGASPVAQFSINPGTFCAPNSTVTFTNTSSISDGTVDSLGYVWNFGDNIDSTVKIPAGATPLSMTHTYAAAGPYNVTLIAVSNKGCTNTYGPTTVTINPQPVAVIYLPLTPEGPISHVCLNDSFPLRGNLNVLSWTWNFGDGSAVTANNALQNPNYKWNAPGKYGVSLVVTSLAGCQSAPVIDSILVNALPVANFTVNNNLPTCANNIISFTDASTVPAGSTITEWHWDFGDGSATSTLQNPTHTYSIAGTYEVKLWVSDGCISNTDSIAVTINPLPNVNFQVPPICLPGTTQFNDISTVSDGSGIFNETWSFGDNSVNAAGAQPIHQYVTGGIYPVTLTVVSGNSCIGDTTINVTAYNIPVSKDSIVNDTALCSNQPVLLINESFVPNPGYGSISKVDIFWNYNPNNPAAIPDTTDNTPIANGKYIHNYPISAIDNNYIVRINAYSGNGCTSIPFDDTIAVHASPNAQFATLPPVCQELTPFSLSTYGSDANNLPPLREFYSGNGIEEDSITFSPQLAGPGLDSPIVFTYVSVNGCSDTAQQSITIYPTPAINYGGTQYILENDSATLNPVSVSGIGLQYLWTPYLYLNSDTSSTPLCKPYDSITYTIQVTSEPAGCKSSTTLFVQVLRDFIVPNTFTPNGDGINDTWIIQELPKYPIQQVDVYDRYGQQVFHSHGYNKPWDGSYNGKILGAGTYYYIIQLNGLIAPKVGYVTILK